ncbi:hypothetical protein niasHT_009960 [Heterodera trifolii]|uniref:Uncharacterized protein n=1 Tax=Heterodera trifolii TaxID=157864 RepID=A0ABD2LMS5_9BILA
MLTMAMPLIFKFAETLLTSIAQETVKYAFTPQGEATARTLKTDQTSFAESIFEKCNKRCTDSIDHSRNCGWYDCLPTKEAGFEQQEENMDECCEPGYKLACCKHGSCLGELTYQFVVKIGDKVHIDNSQIVPTVTCQLAMAIIGVKYIHRMDYQTGILSVSLEKNFLREDDQDCKQCGWSICSRATDAETGIQTFTCHCCDVLELVRTDWKWTDQCHYQTDLLNDGHYCPKCNWKIRYNNRAFSCCDKEALKNCSELLLKPEDVSFILEKKQKYSPPSGNDTCLQLMAEKCPCGWGNCKKRQGRRENTCCAAHHDLVCCEGEKPAGNSAPESSVTNAKMPTVFVLLIIMSKMFINRFVDTILWEN